MVGSVYLHIQYQQREPRGTGIDLLLAVSTPESSELLSWDANNSRFMALQAGSVFGYFTPVQATV